jgi:hypothetical protein
LPNPRGIFSGTCDAAVLSHIRWAVAPELDLSGVSAAGLSGRNGYLRVSTFAECNGRLHATAGQQIYERIDGADRIGAWSTRTAIPATPRPGCAA